MINLSSVLKTTSARLSIGNTWLYYDNLTNEWVTLEHQYGRHKNNILYRGNDLAMAIKALVSMEYQDASN